MQAEQGRPKVCLSVWGSWFRPTVNTGTSSAGTHRWSSYLHCTWINRTQHMMWVWTSGITECHHERRRTPLLAAHGEGKKNTNERNARSRVNSARRWRQQLCPLGGNGARGRRAPEIILPFSAHRSDWTPRRCVNVLHRSRGVNEAIIVNTHTHARKCDEKKRG